MSDHLEDMNFASDPFYIRHICDAIFLENLNSDLIDVSESLGCLLTFSPVRLWLPSLTLPNVPSPIVFPKKKRLEAAMKWRE